MKNEELNLDKVETDIVAALLKAASYRKNQETATATIKRDGEIMFKFRVHGLDEDEWAKCRRQNLLNRGKLTEELNTARFMSQAIYEATVDEDKKTLWQNKDVWQKLGVVTGTDVVNAILWPGEKQKLLDAIAKLSGYDDDLEDIMGN